jgi:hypothetical protein
VAQGSAENSKCNGFPFLASLSLALFELPWNTEKQFVKQTHVVVGEHELRLNAAKEGMSSDGSCRLLTNTPHDEGNVDIQRPYMNFNLEFEQFSQHRNTHFCAHHAGNGCKPPHPCPLVVAPTTRFVRQQKQRVQDCSSSVITNEMEVSFKGKNNARVRRSSPSAVLRSDLQ